MSMILDKDWLWNEIRERQVESKDGECRVWIMSRIIDSVKAQSCRESYDWNSEKRWSKEQEKCFLPEFIDVDLFFIGVVCDSSTFSRRFVFVLVPLRCARVELTMCHSWSLRISVDCNRSCWSLAAKLLGTISVVDWHDDVGRHNTTPSWIDANLIVVLLFVVPFTLGETRFVRATYRIINWIHSCFKQFISHTTNGSLSSSDIDIGENSNSGGGGGVIERLKFVVCWSMTAALCVPIDDSFAIVDSCWCFEV
jgi:hypothetical protein